MPGLSALDTALEQLVLLIASLPTSVPVGDGGPTCPIQRLVNTAIPGHGNKDYYLDSEDGVQGAFVSACDAYLIGSERLPCGKPKLNPDLIRRGPLGLSLLPGFFRRWYGTGLAFEWIEMKIDRIVDGVKLHL